MAARRDPSRYIPIFCFHSKQVRTTAANLSVLLVDNPSHIRCFRGRLYFVGQSFNTGRLMELQRNRIQSTACNLRTIWQIAVCPIGLARPQCADVKTGAYCQTLTVYQAPQWPSAAMAAESRVVSTVDLQCSGYDCPCPIGCLPCRGCPAHEARTAPTATT